MLFVILLLVLPVTESLAWSRTGHMVIAAMAYRNLPERLQEEYTEILRAHPFYEAWEEAYNSLSVDISLGEYLFMQASFWPDVIRRAGVNAHDFPTWHYTNYPLTPQVLSGNVSTIEPTLTPENDVQHGFRESLLILFSDASSNELKAIYLSWVIHLVGDAHQPLHCVALVTDLYPEGDRGGNLFFVRPTENSEGINLHAFWDGLLGRSADARNARNETTRLLQQRKEERYEGKKDASMMEEWMLEGRELAIEYVYLRGTLPATDRDHREKAAILPADYAKNAKEIAEKRSVLAGYRLARVLSGKS